MERRLMFKMAAIDFPLYVLQMAVEGFYALQ